LTESGRCSVDALRRVENGSYKQSALADAKKQKQTLSSYIKEQGYKADKSTIGLLKINAKK
jgi:hypothetical protein